MIPPSHTRKQQISHSTHRGRWFVRQSLGELVALQFHQVTTTPFNSNWEARSVL